MGVSFDAGSERSMALEAHAIGVGRKSQRDRIRWGIYRMRIVAACALRRSLAVAFRASEGFDDKSSFAEAAVFVESPPKKFRIRTAKCCLNESRAAR